MFCVDVAINLPVKNLFKQFTYLVPEQLAYLDVGWRCVVPFGSQTTEGFVIAKNLAADCTNPKLKQVVAGLGKYPWFDAEMLATAKWLSNYYMCSVAEAMRLFVPGKSSIKRQPVYDETGKLLRYDYEERLKDKTVFAYAITECGRQALAQGNNRAKAQILALSVLSTATEPLTVQEMEVKGINAAILRTLVGKGQAEVHEKRILRDSYAEHKSEDSQVVLTDEQAEAVDKINVALQNSRTQTFLLRGITGSGKTEVYLQATAQALALGKQVLVLVPEIALTAQLVERFKARFGLQIAVVHSKLSQNERGDVWYCTHTGKAKVLIGVRSAVFAPFQNLGLVIIDEEHESSYKQEERPSYHAREVAAERCRHNGAVLLLGSATPSLESYYRAKKGEYCELVLRKRPLGQPLPTVEIVDMRQELAEKNFSVLSRKLNLSLKNLAKTEDQAIVLLNRRGYSTFVMCRDCGYTIKCDHCDVAMVYHNAGSMMRCHYCGKTLPVPQECPSCHSRRIKFFGTGTQKAEEELGAIDGLKVLRMDQDSTQKKFAHEEILNSFKNGIYNTLIGTQMVAKGHDIPKVTLVGVLSADSSLNLPDFRAAERTFALLTQAAGRAGRGAKQGKVVFQTYEPENMILQLAAKQDYENFAVAELKNRAAYMYPPFCEMMKLTILDRDDKNAVNLAERIILFLRTSKNAENGVEILGPFPGLVPKVRDLYRFNIIVKAKDLSEVKQELLASEFKTMRNIYFDVDPVSVV